MSKVRVYQSDIKKTGKNIILKKGRKKDFKKEGKRETRKSLHLYQSVLAKKEFSVPVLCFRTRSPECCDSKLVAFVVCTTMVVNYCEC